MQKKKKNSTCLVHASQNCLQQYNKVYRNISYLKPQMKSSKQKPKSAKSLYNETELSSVETLG